MSSPQMPSQSGGNTIKADAQAGDWGHASYNVLANDFEELQSIISSFRPEEVQRAADAFHDTAKLVGESIELLARQSTKLSESWGGPDADEAWKAMNKAYEAAKEIHRTSWDTYNALNAHAQTQRNWVNSPAMQETGLSSDLVDGLMFVSPVAGGANRLRESSQGRELMQQLQQHTVQSNSLFSDSVRVDAGDDQGDFVELPPEPPPPPIDHAGGPKVPGGGGGTGNLPHGGTEGGGLPHVGTSHLPPPTGTPPYDDFPGGVDTGDVDTGGRKGGTDLAGYHPPGGGGAGGGGLSGGLGSGGLGGGLGAGGAGAGGLGAAGAGAGGMGAGGGFPGAGAAGRAGAGGMPMGAGAGRGGGGGDEQEQERNTWLAEDEDVWGADGDAAPPVIG